MLIANVLANILNYTKCSFDFLIDVNQILTADTIGWQNVNYVAQWAHQYAVFHEVIIKQISDAAKIR